MSFGGHDGFGFGGEELEATDSGKSMKRLFDHMDGNHNEAVTVQEVEQFLGQRFSAADADGNGKLLREEFMTAEERDPVMKEMRRGRMAEMFSRFDSNQDGVLTQAELLAMGQERFTRLDENSDGKVTPDKIMKATRRFGPRP